MFPQVVFMCVVDAYLELYSTIVSEWTLSVVVINRL